MKMIEFNIGKIKDLCRRYKVRKLYVFGSILTPDFNENSDIDFSVDFDKDLIEKDNLDWADIFFDFLHGLESLFNRKVDLVFDNHISNKFFKEELDNTKVLIYG